MSKYAGRHKVDRWAIALAVGRPEARRILIGIRPTGAAVTNSHDIKSLGKDGRVRWIEVKSTTGTDGRFEWSRQEFENAMKEGRGYELWRVYKTATTAPVAKCFANCGPQASSAH